jgi:hypothetical protein
MVVVVALKVAVVAAAATVTDAGTVSVVLVLVSTTDAPPVGVALLSVTVQVLEAFGPRVVGLHASDDTSTDAERVMVAVAELPLYVAVTVALWLLGMAVVVALKVAVVAVAATVTDAGTVSVVLVLVSVTDAPPVGAALLSVTVQVLEAFGARVVGLHASDDTSTGATRPIAAFAELPVYVAVTVALWSLAMVPAVALKVADKEPAATVTDAGTARAALLSEIAIMAPPAGAAFESVTVQTELVPEVRLAGLHCTWDTTGREFWTLMAEPIPETAVALPSATAPTGLRIEMGTVELLDAESVTVTTATTPLPIELPFMPEARQATEPAWATQLRVLPAAVKAAPVARFTETISPGAYASVHCKAAGAWPAEALKERFNGTEPPWAPEPDARVREVVWL